MSQVINTSHEVYGFAVDFLSISHPNEFRITEFEKGLDGLAKNIILIFVL